MMALLALLACVDQPAEGTAVGNPGGTGSLDVVVTDLPDAIALDAAEAAIDGVSLDDCAGSETWVEVGAILDALPGSDDAFALPGGRWCGLALSFATDATPLTLAGRTDGGTTFTVALAPGPLVVDEAFDVDGEALLLSLSLKDTLSADALEAEGEDVAIAEEDARAVAWASQVEEAGALWEDRDEDVDVGEADAQAGLASAGDAQTASAGCGCAAGPRGGTGWGLGLLGLLLLWRRLDGAGRRGI